MQIKTHLLLILITSILIGCSTSQKVVTSYQTNAEQAELAGNFESATENWRLYFDEQSTKGIEISPENYAKAAKTAIKAKQADLALSWFEKAQAANYDDPETYLMMADIYRQNNRLPDEKGILETYRENFSGETDTAGVNTRLFEIYTQLNDKEKAAGIWPDMSMESRATEKYLNEYFSIVKESGNSAAIDSIAEEILKADPENVKALEWLGEKYYKRAEEKYKVEMKKYEDNHTHVQHFHLVQALKTVTADFQKALPYFKKLWQIEQDPYYAPYLVNIYTRFEDKKNADYYRKFLK
jgi:tetratricopeptide (TPR) repeat protein